MTDPRTLLECHRPRLVYDAQEAYFADSAAIWTDSPTNELRRADGTVLAKTPTLSLDYLGTYEARKGDVIGDTTRDYAQHAARMHGQAKYANRIYGHARRDRTGRLWLQYWLFYYYNDFRILGWLSGGKHEGDWELVQIELDDDERPIRAVFSQHREAKVQPWARLDTHGPRPLVYIARGSHANYFEAGTHWTGSWVDRADGKGPRIDPTLEIVETDSPKWLRWPGRWGDTTAGGPLDSNSPTSPGTRPHWKDPLALIAKATPTRTAAAAPPPKTAVHREQDKLVVTFDAPPEANALVVATRPRGSDAPAHVETFPLDAGTTGQVEVPARSDDDEVWTSAITDEGPSASG